MKCPICGKGTLILETRHNETTNTIYRRRTCTTAHRFTTVESVTAVGTKRAPKRPVVAVQAGGPKSAGVPAQAGKGKSNH